MTYNNEVNSSTVSNWLESFNNCSNNIFIPFQNNEIDITQQTFQTLNSNNPDFLNIYFGLDDNSNPKLIIVGSVFINGNTEVEENGFSDILSTGMIYELYTNQSITKVLAQQYISNWKLANASSSLFKKSILTPISNYNNLFNNLQADPVRIFLGMDKVCELIVMQKDPNAGDGAIVLNTSFPCPSACSIFGTLSL